MSSAEVTSNSKRHFERFCALVICLALALLIAALAEHLHGELIAELVPVVRQVDVHGHVPAGAVLDFHRRGEKQLFVTTPRAVVDGDGQFRTPSLGSRDGLRPGEYTVTARWQPTQIGAEGTELGPNLLASEYSTMQSSPLRVSVKRGGLRLEPFVIPCRCSEALAKHP